MHLRRGDYPDFWTYYRDLYVQGIKFDIENPLHSRLLYNISISKHSPALQQVFATWKVKALKMFESMIIQEIESGEFRRDVPVKTMAHFLYSISAGIGEYMKDIHSVDFEENLKVDKPLLDGKTKVLLKSIDESILLLQSAFNKKTP